MIAMMIANDPDVLIADEPTTALDVTIQAQILELLKSIQERTQTAVVFITHDLGVIARVADRVQVMYAGRVAEVACGRRHLPPVAASVHGGLARVVAGAGRQGERLKPIIGSPPSMLFPPSGCAFHPRCPLAEASARANSRRCASIDGPRSQDRVLLRREANPRGAPGVTDGRARTVAPISRHPDAGGARPRQELPGARRRRQDRRAGGLRRVVRSAAGQDARVGGGVGFGEVDGRALRVAVDRADVGDGAGSRAPTCSACRTAICAGIASGCRSCSRTRTRRSTRG